MIERQRESERTPIEQRFASMFAMVENPVVQADNDMAHTDNPVYQTLNPVVNSSAYTSLKSNVDVT